MNGAFNSALTQGIGTVTGLQDKFSWSGVAAAGVAGGIGAYAGAKFGDNISKAFGGGRLGEFAAKGAINAASGLAAAATRSADRRVEIGSRFFDLKATK